MDDAHRACVTEYCRQDMAVLAVISLRSMKLFPDPGTEEVWRGGATGLEVPILRLFRK